MSLTRDELKKALRKQKGIRGKIREHKKETAAAIVAVMALLDLLLR